MIDKAKGDRTIKTEGFFNSKIETAMIKYGKQIL